jgi:uncharacterized membrane protein (DUF4010 family)
VDPLQAAGRLGAALAVGLLVGLERGWRDRERPEGGRVAGLRTFALIGLLGGLLNLDPSSSVPLAVGLGGVALLFAVSFGRAFSATGTLSITTAVAALVTFGLGALAAAGQVLLAVGTAAVVALLLDLKDELHQGMRRIQPAELNAVLQLTVLTAAILPLLPDEGFGPYQALNPFRLWLAVILIAALSLGGHIAARWRGPQTGLLWSGLLGGLASSTAATLALARTARAQPGLEAAAAAGMVAASAMMFVRMAVVAALLQPAVAAAIGGLLLWMAAVSLGVTLWMWRRRPAGAPVEIAAAGRIFDLSTALGFGLVLAVVAVLSRGARESLGDAGFYGVSFLSGLADVDAPMLTSLHMRAQGTIPVATAVTAIVLAVGANMIVKAGMAWGIGGAAVGRRVLVGYLAALAAGAAAVAPRFA